MPVTMYDQAAHAWLGAAPLLGQSARAAKATSDIWFYLALLVVASVVIVVVGLVVRKTLAGPIESAAGEAVFSLSDLRRMHRQGQLTDEEYQAARSVTLAESGLPPHNDGAPKPAVAARRQAGPTATGAVDESRLGPELLDLKKPSAPGGDSDNPGDDPPEANPGGEPEK